MDDLDVAVENSPTSNGHSGITLVLPSLRALKAANAGKKSKSKQTTELEQRPKISRPVKLKPLKEVLTKLMTQIKKKDDYAFFIRPVDPAQVPGYTDVIKNPMDFGTMTVKVAKGRYRSLDEFTNDFRLVTTNAKTFNPPGSIYYTEADRLETWGLDHVARASAHVIEYETDWNIDVEQEDDGSVSQLPVNIDDEVSTPRDFDGSMAAGSPAPSMTPAPGQAPTGQGKRGPRGPYKKHAQTALSEGLDAEGRMPGAKDGVGVFPAGSDWAELMIALKVKGKRYKTKKERLRFEREGPPYHPDGSLDYAEMEDPFSVLNVFVPDPPVRPQVTPLYPPASTATPSPAENPTDANQHPSRTSQLRIHVPTAITMPSDRAPPILSTLFNIPTQPTPTLVPPAVPPPRPPKKRRHWTIVRNVPTRSRGKDKDGDAPADDAKTAWKVARDAGTADYGSFAAFLGELATSGSALMGAVGAAKYMYGSEQKLFATIRSTVERRGVKRPHEPDGEKGDEKEDDVAFWTDERAAEAWDYLRDVVYGGADGYAYVRSLAEFVAPSVYLREVRNTVDENQDQGVSFDTRAPELPLGVPVARYVEDNLINTVTRGRHGWLRDVLLPATSAQAGPSPARPSLGHSSGPAPTSTAADSVSPFHTRVAALPGAARALASFRARYDAQLDMATLIRTPDELAREGVLEGREESREGGGEDGGGTGEHAEIERALVWSAGVIEELGRRAKDHAHADGDGGGGVSVKQEVVESRPVEEEEEEEEGDAMDVDVDAKSEPESEHKVEPSEEEDPLMKRLRMNLLALAKRAPLDKIAKLPVELVPEHIRGIVPTA